MLKEWCAGGQISTKKELSHSASPKERSNNDRSVARKGLGSPKITEKRRPELRLRFAGYIERCLLFFFFY